MLDILVLICAILIGLCLIAIIVLMRALAAERKRISKLEAQVVQLDSRISENSRRLTELKLQSENMSMAPLAWVTAALDGWRKKGLTGALTILGGQAIRSYLQKRKSKALPSRKNQ